MKKHTLATLLAMAAIITSCNTRESIDYAELVNPFIGTDYTGNVYPGAQAPFGMVQLSPDNGLPGWDRIAGYFYPDSTIAGFSHTHLSGTGAGDLYDISYMPVTYPLRTAEAPLGIHSRFSHSNEEAHAGYYRVYLSDYNIDVELTATERCGIQRYHYPTDTATVLLNLAKAMNWDATTDTHIKIADSCTIEGWRFSNGWARGQKVFFCSRFSQPIMSLSIDTVQISVGETKKNVPGCTTFEFALGGKRELTIVTALSGTSI